jgi:hypothetical protein
MDVGQGLKHCFNMADDYPKTLKPCEFTERLEPIFRHVSAEVGLPGDAEYFFTNWRHLMDQGIARTWEIPGAVLGALFYPNIYTGKTQAVVMFWFALPEVRGTGSPMKLLDEFEKSAVGLHKSAAAHSMSSPERMRKIYRKRGYELSEEIWSKL